MSIVEFGLGIKVNAMLPLLLLAAACNDGPKPAVAIGEAFVGPSILKIRSDIPVQSAPVATVAHGDRLQILQKRRTFFRVRTASGAEGWTDQRQLLAASDMAALRRLAALAAKLPSQGAAVPRYGDLKIYTQPSLDSASFVTVKEKEKVEVLTHAQMPRTPRQRTPLLTPAPKKAVAKKKAKNAYPAIPMPKPPPPPAEWLELSKTERDEARETADEAAAPPAPTDDWSLARTAGGQTGWTLTRRIDMAIPDEVAQYAEGHRIVAYFSLGTVRDEEAQKDIWLWATVAPGPHPYDFDSFRIFIWSLRHHRYETAYIERKLTGFEPLLREQVDFTPPGKAGKASGPEKFPGFSMCIQKNDGRRYRRSYALLGNAVRLAGDRPCEAPLSVQDLIASAAPGASNATPAVPPAAAPSEAPLEPLLERMRKRLRGWVGK